MDEFKKACFNGDIKEVKLMIENGSNDWNVGLYGACEGGYLEIVILMIEKGANNWDYGLYYACASGHLEIVNLMIEKGATHWNTGLCHACEGGHLEIVKIMIDKGACDWNWGLCYAREGENLEIVNLMIERGANNLYILENSENLNIYKIYCKNAKDYNVEKWENLVIKQCPIFTLIANKNKLRDKIPIELFRVLKTFI